MYRSIETPRAALRATPTRQRRVFIATLIALIAWMCESRASAQVVPDLPIYDDAPLMGGWQDGSWAS
ncbi:MAG TPA: hypothetical protein VGL13_10910, partial [Polyangiaceae bacterium]